MNDPQMQLTDDQRLLAFRYVAGELTADESEVFEQQMLADQSLCEAVVQAVAVGTLVASAAMDFSAAASSTKVSCVVHKPATHLAQPIRRSYSYLATSVTGCLCLFMLMAIYSKSTMTLSQTSQVVQQDDAALLVSVWATESAEAVDLASDESDLLAEELDVPDWLLAAVSIAGQEEFPADDGMEL